MSVTRNRGGVPEMLRCLNQWWWRHFSSELSRIRCLVTMDAPRITIGGDHRVRDNPPCQRASDEGELRDDAQRYGPARRGWLGRHGRALAVHARHGRRRALRLRDHGVPPGVEARHPPAPARRGVGIPRLGSRNRTRRGRRCRARARRGRLRAEERLPRVREHGRRAGVHALGLRRRRESRRGRLHPLRRRPPAT